MYLSDEQMGAVNFGKDRRISWSLADLPIGRQSTPTWALGFDADFVEAYSNAPRYAVKAKGDLRKWENKRFTREGSRFMALSGDGRAEVYYQDGALSIVKVKRFQTLDGQLHSYRPQSGERVKEYDDAGQLCASYVPHDPGEWVEVERLCTPQQDGFGGAHVDITLVDGTEVTLRGPWHGGAPEGFMECSYVDIEDRYFGAYARHRRSEKGPRWRRQGGVGGLFITEELFLRLFARFLPHLRVVAITEDGRTRLQATKAEWDYLPKAVVAHQKREAQIAAGLTALCEATEPVGPVSEADHPLAPWVLNELVQRGQATRSGAWNAQVYSPTPDAQRCAGEAERSTPPNEARRMTP